MVFKTENLKDKDVVQINFEQDSIIFYLFKFVIGLRQMKVCKCAQGMHMQIKSCGS